MSTCVHIGTGWPYIRNTVKRYGLPMATIRKRTNAAGVTTYQVRWRQGEKEVSETFTTAKAANKFRGHVDAAGQHEPAGWVKGHGFVDTAAMTPGTMTLDVWAPQAIAARSNASPRGRGDYTRQYWRHISPTLGALALAAITPSHVGQWLADMADTGAAAASRRNYHGLLSTILSAAVTEGLLTRNVAEGLGPRVTEVRTEKMTFLTPAEFAYLYECVPAHYQPFTHFLAATGMRFGEATAIKVGAVDLAARTATVEAAWSKGVAGTFNLGDPKTRRSRRTISIDDDTAEMIRPLIEGRGGDELLFTAVEGGRIAHANYYPRVYRVAVARARHCAKHWRERDIELTAKLTRLKEGPNRRLGVWKAMGATNDDGTFPACGCVGTLTKQPDIHALRHSHASWLIAAGVPLTVIQHRLGHESITTTSDRYGHLMPEADALVRDAVAAIMHPKPDLRSVG